MTMTGMATVYRRPVSAMRHSVKPQLASWDRAAHPSQVKLRRFLAQVDAVAGPALAAVTGRVAVELIVGFSDGVSLTDGGHDLDNYLFPVVQRLGPQRVAAVDRLEHRLAGYHAYHATRADLLRRLGRSRKSRAAYDRAIDLAGNTAETAYQTRRRDQLG